MQICKSHLLQLQNSNSFAYVIQYHGQLTITPSGLHIVIGLHIHPYVSRYSGCRLNLQCVFGGYRAFAVYHLVKHGIRNATFHVILTRLSVFLPDVSGWTVVARAVRKFFLFPYPQLFVMITNIQQTADCYYLLVHNIPNGKFKSVLPIYPHG